MRCGPNRVGGARLWGALALLAFGWSGAAWAKAATKDLGASCLRLYQQQRHLEAGACFELRVPRALKLGKGSFHRSLKVAYGRLLRNAALAYRAGAKKSPKQSHRAFWYERAAVQLELYLKRGLYENKYRRQSAAAMLFSLRRSIGYAPLTILCPHARCQGSLEGFRFRVKVGRRWSRNVRPGRYRLRLRWKGQSRSFALEVEPRRPKIFTVAAPAARARPPVPRRPRLRVPAPRPTATSLSPQQIGGWVAIGGAALFVVAGVAMLSVGVAADDSKEALYRKARLTNQPTLSHTTEIRRLHDQAALMLPLGYACLAVAGGAALLGGFLLATVPKSLAKPQAPSK